MIPVKSRIADRAHVSSLDDYERLYRRSLDQTEEFWLEQSERLDWFHRPTTVLDVDMEEVDFSWFGGGRINACFNCVDRHLEDRGDQTAILWAKDEPGDYQHITYRDLKHQVCRVANVLLAHGVRPGDRVAIYLPMVPELAYTMLACARIGAVHVVVFSGFSAESLRKRILDAGCRILVTANEGVRGGRCVGLKATADQAIAGLMQVETVLVARRTESEVPMTAARDFWLPEEMAKQRSTCPALWMHSESPLFVLYTSGAAGRPKGVLHTTAGYLLYASLTHELVFDTQPGDVHFCAADVGWITGHSYVVYGPLANGATTVMFESTPTYPDPGRYWGVVEDLEVTSFYTAPTALRALHRAGNQWVEKYRCDSLRVLGSVGEPISPEIWSWYNDVVGGDRCAIVDTWWQTETGGVMISPLPGATPCKPGSATHPLPGIEPLVVDDDGVILEGNGVRGNLCLERPWPGQARTIWGDHSRFKRTYFSRFPGLYFTGDGCVRDEDGYYWITGRVDDVLNVSGYRVGTAEIESALGLHEMVAEAAVVGFPHDLKGTGIFAFVIVRPDLVDIDPEELAGVLKEQVRHSIGPIAVPDKVQVCAALPKKASGKILRRVLRRVAAGSFDDLGDLTVLDDPESLKVLVADAREAAP